MRVYTGSLEPIENGSEVSLGPSNVGLDGFDGILEGIDCDA